MKPNTRTIIWHILGCVAFLAIPIFLFPHPPEDLMFLSSMPTQRDLIANALMLVFFYLNFYFLIPKLYFRERHIVYLVCIVVSFLVINILPSVLTGRLPVQPNENMMGPPPVGSNMIPVRPPGSYFIDEMRHHIFLFAAVVFFSVLLRVRGRLLLTEQARYNAELTSLKDQINPHFLFNTLNGIYALAVRDKSSATATSILKLSGLMRYVVTETGNGFVSLEKEIAYINDYIELQKMRLDKRVRLLYGVIGSVEGQKIAPLTLIPFIENAFKYGVNPDEDSSINILIEITKTELKLIVENNKVNITLSPHERSGKGIQNTKSRLNLLYPSRHFLILDNDEKHFRVQLNIKLL